MTNKVKLAIPALTLMLFFLSSSTAALAQNAYGNGGDTGNANSSSGTAGPASRTREECLAKAKDTRLTAVKDAASAAKTANSEARKTKASALASAKSTKDAA